MNGGSLTDFAPCCLSIVNSSYSPITFSQKQILKKSCEYLILLYLVSPFLSEYDRRLLLTLNIVLIVALALHTHCNAYPSDWEPLSGIQEFIASYIHTQYYQEYRSLYALHINNSTVLYPKHCVYIKHLLNIVSIPDTPGKNLVHKLARLKV